MHILFVSHNRLGDAVLSTGVLETLLARHPGARITVACGPVPAPIFEGWPTLERVIPLVKRPWAGHWRDLWWQCRGTVWDQVVDLRGSGLAWTVLARRRRVLRPAPAPLHRVRHVASVMGDDTMADAVPDPVLRPQADHLARAAERLAGSGPVLALGPTANWAGKLWPADRFAVLIERLTGPGAVLAGAAVAVLGAGHEQAMAAPVLAAVPADRRIDLVGGEHLLTLAACLGRASLYVGNDSGLMHMAAAMGAPTLGLFGPSREELYAPWGPRARALRGARSFADIRHDPAYDYRRDDNWMGDLSIDAVEAAALDLLAMAREGAA